MHRQFDRRQFIIRLLVLASGASLGCGTVLHPERKGQPAGDLDWSIVALDAVGLLFFFVPGVIAFAVDFNNGSIYLPPAEFGHTRPLQQKPELTPITLGSERPTLSEIEAVIARHTGKPVDLLQEGCETHPLRSLDDFWTVHAKVKERLS